MADREVASLAEISCPLAVSHRQKILRPRSFAHLYSSHQETYELDLESIVSSMNTKIHTKRCFFETRIGWQTTEYCDFLAFCIDNGPFAEAQIQPFDFVSLRPSSKFQESLLKDQKTPFPLTRMKKFQFARHISSMDLENDSRMHYDSIWKT